MSFLQLGLVIVLSFWNEGQKEISKIVSLIAKTEKHERFIYRYALNTVHSQIVSIILN